MTAWRIGDAVWSVLAGLVAATVAFVAIGAGSPTAFETFAILLPAQEAATLITFYGLSRRRISRPLRELGLPPLARDAWLLGVGLVLAVAATLVLLSLSDVDEAPQEIARIAAEAEGVTALLAFVGTVLVAPVVEEIVFRGGLQRGLERYMPFLVAALISSAAFAGFHYGGRETLVVLPPLFVLGLILAFVARRRGVGGAVYVHSGFNLLAAVSLLLS